MDHIRFNHFLAFFLVVSCSLRAQSTDTLSSRQLIENGTTGDIILGKENKKNQLLNPPVPLRSTDRVCKKVVVSPAKKYRRKKL